MKDEIEILEKLESIKSHKFNRLSSFYRSLLLTVIAAVAVAQLFI